MSGLIVTAKTNDTDPQAWRADALARSDGLPPAHPSELLPWTRKASRARAEAAKPAALTG